MPGSQQHPEWDYHEENIAALQKTMIVFDIGIGDDAMRITGLDQTALAKLIRDNFDSFVDGGAHLIYIDHQYPLYVYRRGRHVDAGTRKDFQELGWEVICDTLDKQGK